MPVQFGSLAETIHRNKYSLDGKEPWEGTALRVVKAVVEPYYPDLVDEITQLIIERKFIPGGRYLYASGKPMHQVNNCVLMRAEDSREGWASVMQRATQALMTGAGIGNDYSALREEGALVKGMGGFSTGPLALMNMVNEGGRYIKQGGSRRAAIWAGLNWKHPDIFKFIVMKNWSDDIMALKEKDFNFPAPMDMTNISVLLDDDFFLAMEGKLGDDWLDWANRVYWTTVEQMLKTGEPGFSIDVGENAGETLRNACTEITSADDNDICNLGSINLARVESVEEMQRVTELGTLFLLCGTRYSMLPYPEIEATRTKNRRLGLGLMGVYEWLVTRGKDYAPDDELGRWLGVYATSTEIAAKYAADMGISAPVKTRALAPNGTIGIMAETTTSLEPLFAHAIKRRYLDGNVWKYQYVIDSMTERLVEQGVDPKNLPTAYELARTPEKRIAFQAWVQQYVDHGISSTLNLPAWEEHEFTMQEFGEMLLRYLPKLRGITAYPNNARGGQPLTAVSYEDALNQTGVEFEETSNEHGCKDGVCGL